MRLFSPTGDPSLGPERDFREIESPNGVCWCMTSPSHHQPENLDRSLWVDPSRETLGETLGVTLGGSSRIPRDRHHTTPPSDLRPKNGGSPPSSPHGEREEKGEEKGGLHTLYPQFFSGGEPPHPPSTGTKGPTCGRRKRQKGGGARLARGSDKIDRSHRDEFNGTGFTLIPRFPTELQRSKVYTFPWGHSTLLVG